MNTVNHTCKLSGVPHVIPFHSYGKHSTGPSAYGPSVRTCSKLFSGKFILTVCNYRALLKYFYMYQRVSQGSLLRVPRYGLLNLWTVECDHWECIHCAGFTSLHRTVGWYSISQEICTRFCCALLCCGYAIVHNEFTWSISIFIRVALLALGQSLDCHSASEVSLMDMGKSVNV